jgi:hypothetical protein
MNMKTVRTLSALILAATGMNASLIVAQAETTNAWGVAKEVSLPGSDGKEDALERSLVHEVRRPHGRSDTYVAQLVVVPNRQLAWIGYAKDKYICLTNAIVGMSTDADALLINRQEIHLNGKADQQAQQLNGIALEFEKKMKSEVLDDSKILDLGESLMGLRGESPFLPPPQRVRRAAPATISDIKVAKDSVTVTLTGENDIRVILVFDASLNLVKGSVGDKVVYPRSQPRDKQNK